MRKMMLSINAKIRKEMGKSASRRLRKNNKLPAIIYGGHKNTIHVELNHNEIINQETKMEFWKVLILMINNIKIKVKVQVVQRHPFKPKLIHIDFLRV